MTKKKEELYWKYIAEMRKMKAELNKMAEKIRASELKTAILKLAKEVPAKNEDLHYTWLDDNYALLRKTEIEGALEYFREQYEVQRHQEMLKYLDDKIAESELLQEDKEGQLNIVIEEKSIEMEKIVPEQNGRGGKRKGSGRKSLGGRNIKLTLILPEEEWNYIDTLVAERHVDSRAAYFRQLHMESRYPTIIPLFDVVNSGKVDTRFKK